MIIHYCDFAAQPDIHYACHKWVMANWQSPEKPPFLGNDKEYYIFDRNTFFINCPTCLELLRSQDFESRSLLNEYGITCQSCIDEIESNKDPL